MKYEILNCELCIMNYALSAASCVLRIWHLIRQNESVEDFARLFILIEARQNPVRNKQPTPTLSLYANPLPGVDISKHESALAVP